MKRGRIAYNGAVHQVTEDQGRVRMWRRQRHGGWPSMVESWGKRALSAVASAGGSKGLRSTGMPAMLSSVADSSLV